MTKDTEKTDHGDPWVIASIKRFKETECTIEGKIGQRIKNWKRSKWSQEEMVWSERICRIADECEVKENSLKTELIRIRLVLKLIYFLALKNCQLGWLLVCEIVSRFVLRRKTRQDETEVDEKCIETKVFKWKLTDWAKVGSTIWSVGRQV